MVISSLKDLEKLMRLCKRQGIRAIKIDNIEFALTSHEEPTLTSHKTIHSASYTGSNLLDPGPISVHDKVDITDELSQEQLLYYSSAGTEA